MIEDEKKIYIIFKKDGETLTGHVLTTTKPTKDSAIKFFDTSEPEATDEVPESTSGQSVSDVKSFALVEETFQHTISMFREAVISTIKLSPMISAVMIASRLGGFAEKRGEKLSECCSDEIDVFELPFHTYGGVMKRGDEARAAVSGARHMRQIAIIGIISAYDAFLSDLLRAIFTVKPELIFTSDREIKFSDLMEFGSIDAARESIIAEESESVLRKSHHEQFSWMEKKFSIPLRNGLDVWPEFIELCERRNLLTHTNGVVSDQYIKNCKDHGCKVSVNAGDKLVVDFEYLVRSIEIVAEVGLKLVHTMWRKFDEGDRGRADNYLNNCCMALIQDKKYETAIQLLTFATQQKKHSSDATRRMMVVNLANALKLSGEPEKAKVHLNKEDWSATSPQFQICVAAVLDNHDRVCELLQLGAVSINISASDFRDWPVFKSSRSQDAVAETFLEIFGEPLFRPDKVTSIGNVGEMEADSLSDLDAMDGSDLPKVIH